MNLNSQLAGHQKVFPLPVRVQRIRYRRAPSGRPRRRLRTPGAAGAADGAHPMMRSAGRSSRARAQKVCVRPVKAIESPRVAAGRPTNRRPLVLEQMMMMMVVVVVVVFAGQRTNTMSD